MAFSKFFVNGQTGTSENWSLWFGDHFYSYIATGFEVTEDSGLDVEISAGRAYVKDTADGKMFQIISSAAETLTMTDDATNYVFLHCDNGSDWLTASTSSALPVDGILLAVVTTESGAIMDVADYRFVTPIRRSEGILRAADISSTSALSSGQTLTITAYLNIPPGANRILYLDEVGVYLTRTGGASGFSVSTKIYVDVGDGETEEYSSDTTTSTEHKVTGLDLTNIEDINQWIKIRITTTLTQGSGSGSVTLRYTYIFANYHILK